MTAYFSNGTILKVLLKEVFFTLLLETIHNNLTYFHLTNFIFSLEIAEEMAAFSFHEFQNFTIIIVYSL